LSKARRLRRSLAFLVGLGLFGGSIRAGAQAPEEEAIRFQYAAPAECPDVAAFTGRVRQRTARGRVAEPDELARTFNVSIAAANAGGFTGTVDFLDDAGSSVSRRIHGQQCDEVVSSLALVTALALDASLRPTEATVPAARPVEAKPPEPKRPEGKRDVQPSPTRWVDAASKGPSARVGVAGGYRAPLDAYSLGLLGELDWGGAVSARLAAHYASADRNVGGRRANLRLMGVEASACLPRELLSTTWIHFCGALDMGSLRAQGLESPGLTSLDSRTILWVAVGAELRLAWEPDAPFWVELNGQLGVPLVNHRFIFENPDTTVFEIEGVDLTAGAGVATGVRFW
jgi:hypothetical protein